MVIGLQKGRATTLEQNDGGVDHFIELGEIEKITPITERIVPQKVVLIAELIKPIMSAHLFLSPNQIPYFGNKALTISLNGKSR